jgi:hypothetical protein
MLFIVKNVVQVTIPLCHIYDIMAKEEREFIDKQQKRFIKINMNALNDAEKVNFDCQFILSIIVNQIAFLQELSQSNKKKSRKRKVKCLLKHTSSDILHVINDTLYSVIL